MKEIKAVVGTNADRGDLNYENIIVWRWSTRLINGTFSVQSRE